MGETMEELRTLSDAELRDKLIEYGIADGPVTKTTRDLFIRRLNGVMEAGANGSLREEALETRRPSSTRRRSVAVNGVKDSKPKTRQRVSLAPPVQVESKTDDSDDYEAEMPEKKSTSRLVQVKSNRKSLNGKQSPSTVSDVISDDDLRAKLTMFQIPCPVITMSNKPILIKKLNHASAKLRRESKGTSPLRATFKPTQPEADEVQETDEDIPDNSRLPPKPEKKKSSPVLSYSQLHSLTLGNQSSTLNESYLKMNTSIPNNNIINRFVEEQEHYDTGSDSEVESMTRKTNTRKSWGISSVFPSQLFSTTKATGKQAKSFLENLKAKLSIMWQWQFIAVILPLLAVLFFTVLAAFYIKASYNDQYELKDPAVSTRTLVDLDPTHRRIIQDMVSFLEKRVAQQICNQEETKPFTSEVLLHHMKMTESELETIKKCVHDYPYLGIHVENDVWSIPPGRLPLWCTVKTFLWNMLLSSIFVIVSFGVVIVIHFLVTAANRRREREEQEVYSIVEMIIDLLARHHATCLAENRADDAFLVVNHVRDVLIPIKEKMAKLKLWNKAVQFLEENESRVKPDVQHIQGDDLQVWRWLPPSACSPTKLSKLEAMSKEETDGSQAAAPVDRPKLWQGQAFSTDSSGVNSPPPYPLTQCLKVRNMFDAEVEVGDCWPVRIQDAILEKAEGGKILHLAVDRGSREGCVYIKCSRPEEAGKVYRSLHGWWFDGNLVTVKYLRPERYHYRFPDSIHASVPLQPSNDKRLSLPTKYWKSPLEHF